MSTEALNKIIKKSEKEKIKKELYNEYELFKVSNIYNEMDLIKSISNVVSSIISLSGLKEQVQTYHRKNILMLIATIFGVFGAVVFKFPKDQWLILLCVGGFFLSMFGTLLVDIKSPFSGFTNSYLVPKNLQEKGKFSLKNIWNYNKDACYFTPKLNRTSNNIEFLIQNQECQVSKTIYIGKLFTCDGYINTDQIFEIVTKLIVDLYNNSNEKKRK
ncbi:uncharacterized protein cubi_00075 [Cryptosporidium ubiquitum]|uniref:Uncharacterized protein n=1 Tax=Cryptosporidium ubiquitum TaxID=857276 RepID=A0A1J4MJT0_9CRYT|nr:uncharacterized protein cubi_00075 [Cryptosporidium ubiquitum]OII74522.1 hypothetical protein cubi_00075 [Cryptosporidium ubiquitum]